ncbi:MAG: hypothetical protein ACJ75B_01845 [Flavisolibacter sp.]
MKSASISEIREELRQSDPAQLVEHCVRLCRFKKENKELLGYLLFESHDPELYIKNIKEELDEAFLTVNRSQLYQAKKTLRKILRLSNKYIRYIGSSNAEIEILLHYCSRFKSLGLPLHKSTALFNLYRSQLKKIATALSTMHEDLQYDYKKELEQLEADRS